MSQSESDFFKQLIPIGNDTWEKESFESYKRRVGSLVFNMPDCVLENWIYRHYSCVVSTYSFLNFSRMHFAKEEWSTDKIYHLIKSYDDSRINNLGYQLYKRKDKTWLQKYMMENMTWPVPIIVLENMEPFYLNHRDLKLGSPFHLLEGHLRLNYFREIYRTERESLKERHLIWKVTVDK